jgi:urease accessory protein
VLTVSSIVGYANERDIARRLHHAEHEGKLEYVTLNQQDTQRHRLRITTDRGTDVAIALPRHERLANGVVLYLDEERAIVVRMQEPVWLFLRARDAAAALELGYFAGNMHWKVRFDGEVLQIAAEGPEQGYLDRMAHLIAAGKVSHVEQRNV